MGCIPPIPDPATQQPTCPAGYFYDPIQKLCCPVSTAPVDLQDPTIRKLVVGLGDGEINYKNKAMQEAAGWLDFGFIERVIVGILEIPFLVFRPIIKLAASVADDGLAVLADAFQAAQGENASGYYRLAAALMEDMLNVGVDKEQLVLKFRTGGRVAAMRELGGKLVNTLAGEFMGTSQVTTSGAFEAGPGGGIAGLPDRALSPEQGVAGLQAFVGFMAAFAIREGNTDFLAEWIPRGYGHIFKDFAEDFAKNLGIGRLARMAWKPLIATAIATPVQWAMFEQYRPTLLGIGEAYRAWAAGFFTTEQLQAELAKHGLSFTRQSAVQWQHLKGPDRAALRLLHATNQMGVEDYAAWEGREGRTPEVTALLDKAEDMAPVRSAVLRAADSFLSQYLHGKITTKQYQESINSIRKTALGERLLTDGEVVNLLNVQSLAIATPRRHLSVAALTREYEDGVISLGEFEQHITDMGYSPDDVQILVQELLISAKRASDRNARAAAGARRGALEKLSVAKMETAYLDGLLTLEEIRAELAVRQYAPSAIDTIVSEFLVKAGLQAKQPPTA